MPRSVFGVDMGGTKTMVAHVDARGRVAKRARLATRPERGPRVVLDEVAQALRTMGAGRAGSDAVGVGVAGQVDPTRGVLRASPNLPGWRNVRVADALASALGVPVVATNDVRAAAWGEWLHGSRTRGRSLVALYVGTGIGGGVVVDGRPLEGANGTAGELGHQTIVHGGRPCHCRNVGCLEAYAGGWAIAERARERVRPDDAWGDPDAITAETVAARYRQGDALARAIVEETAGFLGSGLVNVANAFNPDRIVLGGGVIAGIPDLVPAAVAAMRRHALAAALAPLRVVRARLGPDACVIGAAAMAREAPARPASRRRRRR